MVDRKRKFSLLSIFIGTSSGYRTSSKLYKLPTFWRNLSPLLS